MPHSPTEAEFREPSRVRAAETPTAVEPTSSPATVRPSGASHADQTHTGTEARSTPAPGRAKEQSAALLPPKEEAWNNIDAEP